LKKYLGIALIGVSGACLSGRLFAQIHDQRTPTTNDAAGNVPAGVAVDAARPPETEVELDRGEFTRDGI
jgi:hypothetical protein